MGNGNKIARVKQEHLPTLSILGTSSVGKDTFFKQILSIYGDDAHLNDVRFQREFFVKCMFKNMKRYVAAVLTISDAKVSKEVPKRLKPEVSISEEKNFKITAEEIEFLREIWTSENGQRVWKEKEKFSVTDDTRYFMENLERVADPKFKVSEEDVLKIYIKTTGKERAIVECEGSHVKIYTFGGDVNQRKKWPLFVKRSSVCFLVSLENESFEESIKAISEVLKDIPEEEDIFLAFTKEDLLKNRITDSVELEAFEMDAAEKFRSVDAGLKIKEIVVLDLFDKERVKEFSTKMFKTVFKSGDVTQI